MRKFVKYLLTETPVGRWTRPALAGAYQRRVWDGSMNLFHGVYASYDEALSAIPENLRRGWNESGIARNLVGDRVPSRPEANDSSLPILLTQPTTFAVLLWLNKAIGPGSRVVDIGGASGITYWHYKDYFPLPDDVTWTVVDMPEIIARSRRLAATGGAKNIQFVEELDALDEYDVVVSLGCVQYMSPKAFEAFRKAAARARTVIINKMPLIDGPEFWTLQSLQTTATPYWIANRRDFIGKLSELGFEVCDAWSVPELRIDIPFAPERLVESLNGLVLRKRTKGIAGSLSHARDTALAAHE
jgi:putative methyltransferase (TIGR04325 family)